MWRGVDKNKSITWKETKKKDSMPTESCLSLSLVFRTPLSSFGLCFCFSLMFSSMVVSVLYLLLLHSLSLYGIFLLFLQWFLDS
jgi:hypothetical protein